MPPRFPHRLARPPSKMDKSEMAVFAVLGASITAGLFQMVSNVFQVYSSGSEKSNNHADGNTSKSAACPMNWGKAKTDTSPS